MLKKLSFILALAILLTACGASAPMETEAPAEQIETTLPAAVTTNAKEEAAECYPGTGAATETTAATEIPNTSFSSESTAI